MMRKTLQHSSFFIVVNLIVVLLGIYAYSQLKIQLTPQLPASDIYISIVNPGVKPDLIEKYVTKPFEEVFSNVEGLASISAVSEIGESKITLKIKPKMPISEAINQVRDLILKNKALLPEGAKDPIVSTENFSALPMMYVSVASKDNQPVSTDDVNLLKKKLKYVEGVASSSIFGLQEKAVYINVSPEKISKYYIPLDGVLAALTLQNSDFSGGKLSNQYKTEYISFDSAINKLEDFGNIDLESNNLPVKLKNIADIAIADKQATSVAYSGNDKIVLLGVFAKSTANPVDVSKNVSDFLTSYEHSQSSLKFQVIIDDSRDILKAFHETQKTLIEAVILVSIIVLLLMGSLRYSLIAICAIPISLAACLIMLYLSGFTINTITMLAMVLSIGLVVDDSIVVIENAEHHYHKTKNALESILHAVYQMFLSVLILMLTLVVIYSPVIFIKGEIGRILQEFALTVTSCLVMSFIVAFTLTPVLFLKLVKNDQTGKFAAKVGKVLDSITRKYRHSLVLVIRHYKIFALSVMVVSFLGLYVAVAKMKVEVEPFEKKDMIMLTNTFQANTSLNYIHHYMKKIVDAVKDNDNIKYTLRIEESPRSTIWMVLKDKTRAKETLYDIEAALAKIALGGDVSVRIAQSKNAGNPAGTYELGFYINNPISMTKVWEAAEELRRNSEPLFSDFVTIAASPVQDFSISCNQDRLFKYGLNQKDISDVLDVLFNARKMGTFKYKDNNYDVIARSYEKFGETLKNVQNMQFTTQKNGEHIIRLKDVCNITRVNSVNQILRFNEQFSIEAVATTKPGVSLNQAVEFLNRLNNQLPDNSNISYTPQTETLIESASFFTMLISIGVFGLYLLMFARFNTLLMPVVILGGIPVALGVALLSLYLTGGSLNIYTEISLITLAGLITKHSVLLCSAIKEYQDKGRSVIKAVLFGSVSRVRAILITSSAMSIGLVSLFFDTGNYANSRFQMAMVLVTGIVIGSILTLYVIPLLYLLMQKITQFFPGRVLKQNNLMRQQ